MKITNMLLCMSFFIGSHLLASDQLKHDNKSQIDSDRNAKIAQCAEQRKYIQEVAIVSAGAMLSGLVYGAHFTNDQATQAMVFGSGAVLGVAYVTDCFLKSQQK